MPLPPRPLPGITGRGRRARWRRVVLRRILSAALAAATVVLVVLALRPPPGPTTAVLVAARAVEGGTVLVTTDLRAELVPTSSAQPGALTALPDAVGRRVAAALAPGEALTRTRLVPRTGADGLPPGRLAVHVVASDPAAVDLLAPGTGARVYPTAGGPALALDAVVLATDPPAPGGSPGLGTPPPRGAVLSLTAAEADAVLAGHGSLDGPVTVTIVSAP